LSPRRKALKLCKCVFQHADLVCEMKKIDKLDYKCQVQALEDKLGIIMISIKANLDDDEFANAHIKSVRINGALTYFIFKKR
jgi:hypothetical protein